jgi:hypothetical protein
MVAREMTHKWGDMLKLYLIVMLSVGTGTFGYRYRYSPYLILEPNLSILISVPTQDMDWRTGSLGGEGTGKEESLINLEGNMVADHDHLAQISPQQAAPSAYISLQNQVNVKNTGIDLGHMYKQCKTARLTSHTVTTTNFTAEQGFTVDEPHRDHIGNLDFPGIPTC